MIGIPLKSVEVCSPANIGANDERLDFNQPTLKEWLIPIILFLFTFFSTSYAGLFYSIGDIGFLAILQAFLQKPGIIFYGLSFSIPLVAILLAHELGHFFACRYYRMQCTPPFFIPAPISIAGTLGAFIRIKSPFRHNRALFDIGIAGPLAGFAAILPLLWIGISSSRLVPKGSFMSGGLSFGEPILFRLSASLLLGYSPEKHDIIAHPVAMAAWIGLLVTSLNLLPIWQLDGGHIAYAILGRVKQRKLSLYSVVFLIFLSFLEWPTPSYLLFGLLLLIFGARFRFYHPPTLSEDEDLGQGRRYAAMLALLILIVSFIPVPIQFN